MPLVTCPCNLADRFAPEYNLEYEEKKNKGFTLIELLVVISIIGLLSSVVLASLNSARAKTRDAKRISDFKAVEQAMYLYYDKHNTVPIYTDGSSAAGEVANFNHLVADLVADGNLSMSPAPPSSDNPYYYYYGGDIGGLLVTNLEAAPDTTTGMAPSCRPWPPNITIGAASHQIRPTVSALRLTNDGLMAEKLHGNYRYSCYNYNFVIAKIGKDITRTPRGSTSGNLWKNQGTSSLVEVRLQLVSTMQDQMSKLSRG